jgi:hypothetical protein
MTFELGTSLTVLDPADNPYMPHHLQQTPLNFDPGHFAILQTLPEPPPNNVSSIYGAHGPVHNDEDKDDDADDNSSDSLDSIEDHEFPFFFSERSSPPRLFHSHGTYSLPVDGHEMKVCTSSFGSRWLIQSSEKKKRHLHLYLCV